MEIIHVHPFGALLGTQTATTGNNERVQAILAALFINKRDL